MHPQEAERKYILLLRSMGGNRRVKIGAELYEMVCHLIESSIKNENPDISEIELEEKLRQRMQI